VGQRQKTHGYFRGYGNVTRAKPPSSKIGAFPGRRRGNLTGSLAAPVRLRPALHWEGRNYSKATIFVNLLVPPKRTCISEWVPRVSPLAATGILRRPRTPASVAKHIQHQRFDFFVQKRLSVIRQCMRNSAIQTSNQNFSPRLWTLFVCNRISLFRYFCAAIISRNCTARPG